MIKKHTAFTLAEVLIALTVIGSVAALLIPKLIYGLKAKQAKSKFNTAYSVLSEAILKMDADDIPLKAVHYPNIYVDFYQDVIKNSNSAHPQSYFKIIQDCGMTLCNPEPAYPVGTESEGGFLANNNMFIFLEDGAKIINNIKVEEGQSPEDIAEHIIVFTVDINGNRQNPNLRGYDIFSYEMDGETLIPVGHPDSFLHEPCIHSANASIKNTMPCSYNASSEDDYFMKLYRGR